MAHVNSVYAACYDEAKPRGGGGGGGGVFLALRPHRGEAALAIAKGPEMPSFPFLLLLCFSPKITQNSKHFM